MVYMYHSFLIHSAADGHLGCFHVLATNFYINICYTLRLSLDTTEPQSSQQQQGKTKKLTFFKQILISISLPYTL